MSAAPLPDSRPVYDLQVWGECGTRRLSCDLDARDAFPAFYDSLRVKVVGARVRLRARAYASSRVPRLGTHSLRARDLPTTTLSRASLGIFPQRRRRPKADLNNG